MLIEFRVSNFRSISKEQVLSLVPANKQTDFPENIWEAGAFKALNGLALYGANSSGKSNLISALKMMDRLIFTSTRLGSTSKLPFDPFLLSTEYSFSQPTSFELTFIVDKIRYRYGFKYNQETIKEEWLFRKKVGREVEVFYRQNDIIEVSSGFDGSAKLVDAAIEATRNNALFLSFCDTFNIKEAKSIFQWLNKLSVMDGLDTEKENFQTIHLWQQEEYRNKIKEYLSLLDLGFHDLSIEEKEVNLTDLPEELQQAFANSDFLKNTTGITINTSHSIYTEDQSIGSVTWAAEEKESEGTKKAIHLSGPLVRALTVGGVLIIDEIEAKMHPIITLNIIKTFLSPISNPLKAQLIFASHDTNLLQYSNLRRDQIVFVEKNRLEATELFSLAEFKYFDDKAERSDTNKEKRYLEGRYGAIPVLGSFRNKIAAWYGKERKTQ